MSALSTKRKRDGAGPNNGDQSDNDDSGDSVIGLDVGGELYYTNKSTLTAGSTYFAARFGGTFNAGKSHVDECGRKVYFIDADGELFKHILAFLRRGVASWCRDDRVLVKRLVAEAEYFGVEAMLKELNEFVCIPPNQSGKGILYWLGTTMGKRLYKNPWEIKQIEIGPISHDEGMFGPIEENMSPFFAYRPPCQKDLKNPEIGGMLWCCHYNGAPSRAFSFKKVLVKPTHYSLRYGACCGMSDWNFEASVDGDSWTILHKARKERHLLRPSREEINKLAEVDDAELVTIAENCHRKTWEVDTPVFYKFFRFGSVCRDELRRIYGGQRAGETFGEDGRFQITFSECLHGVGFELYGDAKHCAK